MLVDSSVYGAAIEDEARYPPDSQAYWDIVYSKALFRLQAKISVYGCKPIEVELTEAPQAYRSRLLERYAVASPLRGSTKVAQLYREFLRTGIYAPDSLILAYSSAHKMDALVTVNRRHLKRRETIRIVGKLSRKLGLRPLVILLPKELFQIIQT